MLPGLHSFKVCKRHHKPLRERTEEKVHKQERSEQKKRAEKKKEEEEERDGERERRGEEAFRIGGRRVHKNAEMQSILASSARQPL